MPTNLTGGQSAATHHVASPPLADLRVHGQSERVAAIRWKLVAAVTGSMAALWVVLYFTTTGQRRPIMECIELFGECAFY